jgi:hypothetical protein
MIKKIDISHITIDDLDIIHDNIEVITLAKVGTTNFSSSLQRVYTNGLEHVHTHGLNILEHILNNNKKNLIISGIRNPLDRNMSYFFETFYMQSCEPILKYNNAYNSIQNTFVCNKHEIIDIKTNELIEIFKNKDYIFHNHFTLWLEQFFSLTNIQTIEFDKEKGLQLYKLDDDNYILFYVLEKYKDNIDILEKFLKLSLYDKKNQIEDKYISNKYKEFKENIKLDYNYKESLLNTSAMKYFYSDEFIQKFHSLY